MVTVIEMGILLGMVIVLGIVTVLGDHSRDSYLPWKGYRSMVGNYPRDGDHTCNVEHPRDFDNPRRLLLS